MSRILVLDNRDSFVYNLVQLLREAPSCHFDVVRGDHIPWGRLSDYQGVLLSPGPGIPDEAPGQMKLIEAVSHTHSILGVCLGHQALAEFFGGYLIPMEHPLHGHASGIQVRDDSRFWQGVSDKATVGRYHSWIVDETSLPSELVPTAWSTDDHILMAIRHHSLPLYGVQFHPESIITDCGHRLIGNWLDIVAQIQS